MSFLLKAARKIEFFRATMKPQSKSSGTPTVFHWKKGWRQWGQNFWIMQYVIIDLPGKVWAGHCYDKMRATRWPHIIVQGSCYEIHNNLSCCHNFEPYSSLDRRSHNFVGSMSVWKGVTIKVNEGLRAGDTKKCQFCRFRWENFRFPNHWAILHGRRRFFWGCP